MKTLFYKPNKYGFAFSILPAIGVNYNDDNTTTITVAWLCFAIEIEF